jgi:methyl-accepting chemotaxis protein
MINDSITRVESGTSIAEVTSASLDTIVTNANEVLTLINNITTAANEQAEMISQVSSILLTTATNVQNNSKFAQEAAATAEELNSQSEMLQQLVAYFKL